MAFFPTTHWAQSNDPLATENLLNKPNFPQESVASSDDITALYFNPAGLAFHPLQFGYYYAKDPSANLSDHTVFLNLLGLAFSSQFRRTDKNDYANRYNLGMSLLNTKYVSWGLSYSWLQSSDTDLDEFNQWDFGFILRPFRYLSLGAVARGINLPTYKNKKIKARWDFGISLRPIYWAPEVLSISLDAQLDPNKPSENWKPKMMVEANTYSGLVLYGGWVMDSDVFFGLKQAIDIAQVSFQATAPETGSNFYAFGVLFGQERFGKNSTPIRNYLEISLDIPFTEQKNIGSLFSDDSITFAELLQAIETAKNDNKITGILLTGRSFNGGWGQAEELRNALQNFSLAKPIYAWLENAENKEYYISSVASSLQMPEGAVLQLNGLKAETVFLKDLFDKVGVKADFVAIGDYKSAPDMFTRNSPSTYDREQIDAMLKSIAQNYVKQVSLSRNKPVSEVNALLNHGLYSARAAYNKGLIDEVSYFSDFEEQVVNSLLLRKDNWRLPLASYLRERFYDDTWSQKPVVAILVLDGEIISGSSSSSGLFSGQKIGSDTIVPILRHFKDEKSIKSVVVRINSPGGSSLASDLIWNEIRALHDSGKHVIVSIGDVAASGGYYIAVGADHILASKNSITGSIGIFSGKFSLKGLYQILGINKAIYKTHPKAAMFTEANEFSPEEKLLIRSQLEEFYDLFLRRVQTSRKIPLSKIKEEAGGKVYTGQYAARKSMVDKNGGLALALELARSKAMIDEDYVEYQIYPRIAGNVLGLGDPKKLVLPAIVHEAAKLVSRSEQMRDDKVIMLMPYEIDIE